MSEQADADHDGIAARIFGRGTAAADNVTVDATGYFAGFAGDDKIGEYVLKDGEAFAWKFSTFWKRRFFFTKVFI